MAKRSIITAIKAKPNARGKRSHLPLECSNKGCTNDFHLSYSASYPPKRVCEPCYHNPPQSRQVGARIAKLKSMGLL